MAQENFDVIARLRLEASKGAGQLKSAGRDARGLKQGLDSATSSAAGLWKQVAGLGAAYLSFNAISGAVASVTRKAVGYTAELERMGVGLTSVLSAVEGVSWEKAAKRSALAFDVLKTAAIESPAGPQELFSIFQGIVGPIEAAGFSMQRVLDITTDTVSAASALHVDFGQAQRDISLMVRGAAGMDVKLFSLLRSTGAIVETTEEWNKKLTQAERVNKVAAALARFRAAGDKYAHTWAGITQTMGGIFQEFGRAAVSPVMAAVASRLERLNDYLLKNRVEFEANLTRFGDQAAAKIDRVFARAQAGFEWTVSHWDQILARAEVVGETLKRWAPLALAPTALNAGGAVLGAAGGIGSFLAGGGGAAAAGGTAAGGAAAAAAGGGAAAIGAPVVAALAGIAAVAAFAGDHLQLFSEIWTSMTAGLGGQLMELWESLKGAFLPLLKSWGGVLSAVLIPTLQLAVFAFRGLIKGLSLLLDVAGAVYGYIYDKLGPVFEMVLELFTAMGEGLRELGKILGFEVDRIRGFSVEDKESGKYEGGLDRFFEEHSGFMQRRLNGDPEAQKQAELLRRVPAQRSVSQVNNDFRGSRITVKQDFKGKADPDRIVSAMMTDLTRQAERRISSGFLPAFSR
jgi:hypothetical protein